MNRSSDGTQREIEPLGGVERECLRAYFWGRERCPCRSEVGAVCGDALVTQVVAGW
jgi:hypothetical protein